MRRIVFVTTQDSWGGAEGDLWAVTGLSYLHRALAPPPSPTAPRPMSLNHPSQASGNPSRSAACAAPPKDRRHSRGDRITAARAIQILGWPKKKFYRALQRYAGDPIVVPVANKAFRKIETVPLFGGEKHEGAAWEFSEERCQQYAARIKAAP